MPAPPAPSTLLPNTLLPPHTPTPQTFLLASHHHTSPRTLTVSTGPPPLTTIALPHPATNYPLLPWSSTNGDWSASRERVRKHKQSTVQTESKATRAAAPSSRRVQVVSPPWLESSCQQPFHALHAEPCFSAGAEKPSPTNSDTNGPFYVILPQNHVTPVIPLSQCCVTAILPLQVHVCV